MLNLFILIILKKDILNSLIFIKLLGDTSDIFTSNLYNHYNAPSNFCFDIECSDTPIIDDEDSTEYNYDTRVCGIVIAFTNI